MKEFNNTAKLIGAMLIGTAVGGLLGILLAPYKGSVTSQKIVKKSSELKEALKEKFHVLLSDIKNEEENEFLEIDSQHWRS